jgi:hypothetical protein
MITAIVWMKVYLHCRHEALVLLLCVLVQLCQHLAAVIQFEPREHPTQCYHRLIAVELTEDELSSSFPYTAFFRR